MATKRVTVKGSTAEAKAFRHTRTGAIRMSTTTLGYPFAPAEVKASKATEPAKETDK